MRKQKMLGSAQNRLQNILLVSHPDVLSRLAICPPAAVSVGSSQLTAVPVASEMPSTYGATLPRRLYTLLGEASNQG